MSNSYTTDRAVLARTTWGTAGLVIGSAAVAIGVAALRGPAIAVWVAIAVAVILLAVVVLVARARLAHYSPTTITFDVDGVHVSGASGETEHHAWADMAGCWLRFDSLQYRRRSDRELVQISLRGHAAASREAMVRDARASLGDRFVRYTNQPL